MTFSLLAVARTLNTAIPAEDLDAFNEAIVGEIEVTAEFH